MPNSFGAPEYPYTLRTISYEDVSHVIARTFKPSKEAREAIEVCKKADETCAIIDSARFKLSAVDAGREHIVRHEAAVAAIVSGEQKPDDFESIDRRSLEREFEEKAEVLTKSLAQTISLARPAVNVVTNAVMKSITDLAEKMEAADLQACENFGIPYEGSGPTKLVRSAAMFLERLRAPEVYDRGEGLPRPFQSSLFFLHDLNFQ